MAVDHARASEDTREDIHGFFYVISCKCGETIEGGPKGSADDAKTAAYTAFGEHIQSA